MEKKSFTQQYSQIYYVRLSSLLPVLRSKAAQKWAHKNGTISHIYTHTYSHLIVAYADRILDTKEGQLTCILGTIYVDMELKPNVLKDLAFDVY